MSYEHLLVAADGPITTVTLNRVDQRNALSLDVMRELTAALTAIARTDARGVILAANGPVFSAGHDFADMAGAGLEQARELFRVCTTMMNTIQSLPQPVVARVHALATAGGCQLVASCDLAVAASTAMFAIPGGKAGLFCHTPLVAVARNVGRKRALEMAMTGDAIDAATAADWGLINKAVAPDRLEAETRDLIERATRGSALSKELGKQAFYRQVDLVQDDAYDFAVERMAIGIPAARLPGEASPHSSRSARRASPNCPRWTSSPERLPRIPMDRGQGRAMLLPACLTLSPTL
ncbi:enoyl-CoA hydratase-related protein [Candidatus Skiveiella danica]|uniref:enoyl-CoA hydratase-related protein n=1 Tax=Candidatus Skiveiella danica TaxID=3386177 RepID=UPI0039B8F99E